MIHSAEIKTVTITTRELFTLQLCAAQMSKINPKKKQYRCWCHMTAGDFHLDPKYSNYSDLHTGFCHDLQRVMKSYDAGMHPNDEE